jgi:hypothetical protein
VKESLLFSLLSLLDDDILLWQTGLLTFQETFVCHTDRLV